MSLLLRTIKSFPSGKTSEELVELVNKDFIRNGRVSVFSELKRLYVDGLIFQNDDGKWRYDTGSIVSNNEDLSEHNENLLKACPADFFIQEDIITQEYSIKNIGSSPELKLIQYFKACVFADVRGSLTSVPDYHGEKWQIIKGAIPSSEFSNSKFIKIRIKLDDLPPPFRKALLKRESKLDAYSLGWPIFTGKDRHAPMIWPIGLFSAHLEKTNDHLEVSADLNNILVNPAWIKNTARQFNFSVTQLERLFKIRSAIPLDYSEFFNLIKEVSSGNTDQPLRGIDFRQAIDTSKSQVWDSIGLFLQDDTSFNRGIINDINFIEKMNPSKLENTSYYHFFFFYIDKKTKLNTLNIKSVNKEQIQAVNQLLNNTVSVITGPPGTGKSETIVSAVASVLLQNGSVLFASRNHQALDAVSDRLVNLAKSSNFIVRTFDKSGENNSFKSVLKEIISEPNKKKNQFEEETKSRLMTMSSLRLDILKEISKISEEECEIAEILERLKTREKDNSNSNENIRKYDNQSFSFFRFLKRLFGFFGKKKNDLSLKELSSQAGASSLVLSKRLDELRDLKKSRNKIENPIKLTDEISKITRKILPSFIEANSQLTKEEIEELTSENDLNQITESENQLPIKVCKQILKLRPLWITSIQSASKRIPLQPGLFDLLIIDEATQSDIASTIPLMIRSKNLAVLGDNNQLRYIPNIGKSQDLNLMKLFDMEVKENSRFSNSTLSLFDASLRVPNTQKTVLKSQYRSAPEIVKYISDEYYEGVLQAEVDPDKLICPKNQKPGIKWTDVKPKLEINKENTNIAEINAIISQLKFLLEKENYKGTIGFIAPFRAQVFEFEKRIMNKISPELLARAKYKAGTIDTFQGDERDLILFSPTVSSISIPSALTFIQRDFRRLNVAISRARAIVNIYGDLTFAKSNKIRSLSRLADFTIRKKDNKIGEGVFDSEWERQLYYAMKDKGLDPIPQYEIAGRRLDFALFGLKKEIKVDIEVDGRRWHTDIDGRRKTSDLWRDHQMKSMGWRVQRFWVDELNNDMEKCIGIIKQKLT